MIDIWRTMKNWHRSQVQVTYKLILKLQWNWHSPTTTTKMKQNKIKSREIKINKYINQTHNPSCWSYWTHYRKKKTVNVCAADTHNEICQFSVSVPRILTYIYKLFISITVFSLSLSQFNPARMKYVVQSTAFLCADQSVSSYRRRGEPFVSLKPFRLMGETEKNTTKTTSNDHQHQTRLNIAYSPVNTEGNDSQSV